MAGHDCKGRAASSSLNDMIVTGSLLARHRGIIRFENLAFACALGPAGIRRNKREGDGATPAGRFALRHVLYRADRLLRPQTRLPCFALHPRGGWCDQPGDRRYNQPVVLPYPASAESLWRTDSLYDVIVVLGHNDAPPVKGHGSAVFFHLARPGFGPTEGCVAVSLKAMKSLLAGCRPGMALSIQC